MALKLKESTIRDFSGGWNVSDSDLNLSSQFQPISENVMRGVDGSLYPRWGYELSFDFKNGVEWTFSGSVTISSAAAGQQYLNVQHTGHGLINGCHVVISGAVAVAGIPASEINGMNGIFVVDANNFRIPVRTLTTGAASVPMTVTIVKDSHLLNGNIIHKHYFNRKLIVFTDIGEVGTIQFNSNGTSVGTVIWNYAKAQALAGSPSPTKRCNHWSSDTYKSTVIACNGYNKDKPIQIKADFTVTFLVDKASGSNAFVPKADFVICMQGYVIFIRTEYGDAMLEISAKNTDGTFTRDPNPADAVEIDLSAKASTVEPVLLGASRIREKLYVAFYDRGMVGVLGTYTTGTTPKHEPNFDDTIAEHGAISHRAMVSLGNDILMADYAGVPSVSVSQQSGVYVPSRLSELISPELSRHLANLTEETLRSKAFAVYSKADSSYILFLPKYEETAVVCPPDPFLFNAELKAINCAVLRVPQHKLIERSYINIANSQAIGSLSAANINGKRKVRAIIDKDYIVVELGGAPASADTVGGGGPNVVYTPVNDETVAYAFEYNKAFKTRRWTRYRDMNFDCAAVSQRGTVFLSKGLKVYRMGNYENPVYADFVKDYDFRDWDNSTIYAAGKRVRDDSDPNKTVYMCTVTHTSPATGTFAAFRDANPNTFEEYKGYPIWWEVETPWSDLRVAGLNKINSAINMSTEGVDEFTVSAFVNELRRDPNTYLLMPQRSMLMQAGDVGGFGQALPAGWGTGRRTREAKLWPFGLRGKLLRWRFEGKTIRRVRIISLTMYYRNGGK